MPADTHSAPNRLGRSLAVRLREPRCHAGTEIDAAAHPDADAEPERVADGQRLADADQPGARQLPDQHPDPCLGHRQPVGLGPSVGLREPDAGNIAVRVSDGDELDLDGHDLRDRVPEPDPRADADTLRLSLPDALPDSPRALPVAAKLRRAPAQTP